MNLKLDNCFAVSCKKYTFALALYCMPALNRNSCFTCDYWWKSMMLWLPDSSMLSVRGCLLKGSVGEFSRWRRMMDRSMMFPEGRITGSVISVSIRGSVITVTQHFTKGSRHNIEATTNKHRLMILCCTSELFFFFFLTSNSTVYSESYTSIYLKM